MCVCVLPSYHCPPPRALPLPCVLPGGRFIGTMTCPCSSPKCTCIPRGALEGRGGYLDRVMLKRALGTAWGTVHHGECLQLLYPLGLY